LSKISELVEVVQQYTHEDQNVDRIKLRTLQEIDSTIMKVQSNMWFKVFRNLSQSTVKFWKL